MANLLDPNFQLNPVQIPNTPGIVDGAPINLLDPNFDPRRPAPAAPISDAAWYQQTYEEPFTGHPELLLDIRRSEDPAGFESYRQWASTAPPEEVEAGQYVPGRSAAERQLELGVQGVGRGLADLAGAPMDIMSLLSNGLNAGIEGIGRVFGADIDLGRVVDPPFGSNAIADFAAPIAEGVGLDVLEPSEMSDLEKLMFNINRFGTQGAVGGGALARRAITGGGAPGPVTAAPGAPVTAPAAPNSIVSALTRPYEAAPTRAVIGDTAAGVGAGTANFAYQENASPGIREKYGPVADAFGNIISDILGGVGGVTTAGIARGATNAVVTPIRNRLAGTETLPDGSPLPLNPETGQPYTRSDVEGAAAAAQRVAVDPEGAAQQLNTAAELFRQNMPSGEVPVVPTSGLVSDDVGLVALENRLRTENSIPFIERDRAVRQAARDTAARIAPKDATGRDFTDAAETIFQNREIDADRLASRFEPTDQPGQAALDIDQTVSGNLSRLQQENSARFRAVDPNRDSPINIESVQDLATEIVDNLGQLADPRTILPAGLLRRIQGPGEPEVRTPVDATMDGPPGEGILDPNNPRPAPDNTIDIEAELIDPAIPPEVSIGEITEIWPELSRTIDRARRAENYTLADNLQAIRTEFNRMIDDAAANGDPAALRAVEAREAWQAGLGDQFGGGTAGTFRRNVNLDRENRTAAPPSQTAQTFLRAGQPEDAAQLNRILNAEGEEAVHAYLVRDMANSGVINQQTGVLNPDQLRRWQERWSTTIAEVSPQTQGLIDDTLKSLDISGNMPAIRGGPRPGGEIGPTDIPPAAVLQARREVANPAQNPGALGPVRGQDPVHAVNRIFSSGDPERALRGVLDEIGDDPVALDGLRASVREFLVERATTSNVAGTTEPGARPLSWAQLDNVFQQHEGVLAQLFEPEQMNALRQSHALLRPLVNRLQQATTGSPTAERSAAATQFWRWFEIAMKAPAPVGFGILKGGGIVRAARLAVGRAFQGAPSEGTLHLINQMMFNPELAAHLLTRPVAEVGTAAWSSQLNRLLAVGEGVRQGQGGDALRREQP